MTRPVSVYGGLHNPLAAAIDVNIPPDVIVNHDSLKGVHVHLCQDITQHLAKGPSLSSLLLRAASELGRLQIDGSKTRMHASALFCATITHATAITEPDGSFVTDPTPTQKSRAKSELYD